jgi:hypothetical protein
VWYRRHDRDDDGHQRQRADDEQQTAACGRVASRACARVHARIMADR